MTQSFADECFGKLAVKIGLDDFNKMIRLENMNEEIKAVIDDVVANRVQKNG